MPNRVIKDSIKRSSEIDSLTWFQEVCFYRLMVTVDDNGCYHANPQILKSDLFPLKEDLTKKAVAEALDQLERVGLIERYKIDGKDFLHMATWAKHQRIRNKTNHYPMPPQVAANCGESPRDAANGGEMQRSAANCGLNPRILESKNPRILENNSCSEPGNPTHEQQPEEPPVFQITLVDKSLYGITREMIEKYRELYPAVNVEQEFRNMIGWTDANPTRRKTKNGINRFINSWLAKAQNNGGSNHTPSQRGVVDFTRYAEGG